MKCKLTTVVLAILLVLSLTGCRFPYQPEPEPGIVSTGPTQESAVRVFPINGTEQICNPSISQDNTLFAGCMLWLNFDGELPIVIPEGVTGFAGESVQHDRLTIVDTSNTLRWFMKNSELGASESEEFQDPEWSAHPEYIITLLSEDGQKEWGCHVVNPASRKHFKLCNKGLEETSTPHLWVDPAVSFTNTTVSDAAYDNDGFADSASVKSYFGTDRVKVVTAKKVAGKQSLYLKDYAADKEFVALARPKDREGWNCESPLISPDGKWILFNAFKSESFYEVYVQELRPGASPIMIASDASDPHWWVHPQDSTLRFIIYQTVPGWNLVEGDLAEAEHLESGQLGSTWRLLVKLFSGAPSASAACVKMTEPELLVNLPTKGGLSRDGRYLCTGYSRAFMVGLE